MNFIGIDHIVLTVKSIEDSIHFYCAILGMPEITFGKGRKAILCGSQKINLHEAGHEFEPHACHVVPGSADICLITDTPLKIVQEHLIKNHVAICEGPIQRSGAKGKLLSIYLRDPDFNLVEVSNYLEAGQDLPL